MVVDAKGGALHDGGPDKVVGGDVAAAGASCGWRRASWTGAAR